MKGSIRRRSKDTYELTIDLGRNAEGKRVRRFVTVKGRRADADKRLRALLTSADKGIAPRTDKVTVREWAAKWLAEYVVPNTKQRTLERYRTVIRLHIEPSLGHVQLLKLSPSDVRGFEAGLTAKGMSPKGVEVVHGVLSGMLKFGMRDEVIWRNVCQAVTPPKVTRSELVLPDVAQVRGILERAWREQPAIAPMLHLIAYTGLRRGEALGLRWGDTDLEEGTIQVVQTVQRSTDKGVMIQTPKTNAGRRVIDLDPGTVEVLRAHHGTQLLQRMQAEKAWQDNDLVFPDALGRPMNPMQLTRWFKRLAARGGLPKARLHDLRHFHATILLQAGENPVIVSKRLGHKKVATTLDLYAHVLPGWQKQTAAAFAKVMDEG
ncbi:MAG: site-specific integrase [Chloroflexi bacterium]|nr:site-specific integrase [Chloroflexota bacterium]